MKTICFIGLGIVAGGRDANVAPPLAAFTHRMFLAVSGQRGAANDDS